MVNTTGAEAWQRVHAVLLQKERCLEQAKVAQALGATSKDQLAALEAEVQQLRDRANAMFNAVFRFYET
ncbi:MAG TPA: hypothetical protein VFM98_20640 [Ramlibacter sp.]|uniref:hypothetical protein n=1 Tax=Ramlibacter sp. TaxID=1917967 RepID=UPI002D81000E|nr:hypothetical protein [Ramlibacter sp.]HET8748017.1 hypothetical protein [Ramlibacter sp.]